MSTDIDFVKFVRQRKHAKPEMEDLYEIDFLGRKREGISFNDTIRNDVKKPKLKEGELSLSDFLTKNKDKIIEEPKKENDINRKEQEIKEEKEEKEESDNESDDLSEERINHYIGGEKNNIDEMQEIINEIKDRTQIIKNKRKKKEKKDKKNKNKEEKNKNKEEIQLNEEESEEIEEKPKKKSNKKRDSENKDN